MASVMHHGGRRRKFGAWRWRRRHQRVLNYPEGVAMDGSGNLFIADSFNDRIRKSGDPNGIITTVAGGEQSPGPGRCWRRGYQRGIGSPNGVAVDASGDLFIVDGSDQPDSRRSCCNTQRGPC